MAIGSVAAYSRRCDEDVDRSRDEATHTNERLDEASYDLTNFYEIVDIVGFKQKCVFKIFVSFDTIFVKGCFS